jgi:hypothetical protein
MKEKGHPVIKINNTARNPFFPRFVASRKSQTNDQTEIPIIAIVAGRTRTAGPDI